MELSTICLVNNESGLCVIVKLRTTRPASRKIRLWSSKREFVPKDFQSISAFHFATSSLNIGLCVIADEIGCEFLAKERLGLMTKQSGA